MRDSTVQIRKRAAQFTLYLPLEQESTTPVKKPRVIVICGPTAVGKSALALDLAEEVGGEIISADSMQVYRGMDIGTAKVSVEDRERVPHHLIDVCDLTQMFNVVKFYNLAHKACREILARGKVPIVVGGTGFYVHSFIYGPPTGPASEEKVRSNIEKQMEDLGPEVLYERLQILDPEYAKTITEHDKHKIVRALEIICISKKRVSEHSLPSLKKELDYDFQAWFIYYPKEILYPKIERRCEEMLDSGFLKEVEALMSKGLLEHPGASQAIGYKQCIQFLQSDRSEVYRRELLQTFMQASRQYAKRQLTWFRKEPIFRWMNLQLTPPQQLKELILQEFFS